MPYEMRIDYQVPVSSLPEPRAARLPADHRLERWWLASYSALQAGVEMLAPQTPLEMNVLEEVQTETAVTDVYALVAEAPVKEIFFDHIIQLPKGAGPG